MRPFVLMCCDVAHMTFGHCWGTISNMKSALQRLLALVLVLSVVPWTQAEVCPMKLVSQRADTCGASAVPVSHVMHHKAQAGEHDCCPKGKVHKAVQFPPVQVSSCASAMACCSIDPQPINSPEQLSVSRADVVIALLDPSLVLVSVHHASEDRQPLPLEDSVFRLKEDLRI